MTWYDFRSNTPDPATLPTDYWLAVSSDGGSTWSETRVAPPFDLALAANAGGLFVGDYQGLKDRDGVFVPFFVRTGSASNRSNVWAAPQVSAASATGAFAAQSVGGPVRVAPATPVDQARLRGSVARRVEWTMKRRVPGWGVVTMRATPATSPDPPAIERGQPRGGRADLRNEH